MQSASVLVLGGAGFIGSNFTTKAVETFDSVTVLDKLTYAGNKENLQDVLGEIRFVNGDVRNSNQLDELYSHSDYVINFAAESHVDRSIASGREFVKSNVEGTFVALDLLRSHDVKRFIHISTDEVYGSIDEGSFTESDSLNPSSPYSASKASADMFVNSMWKTYELPITVVRPSNVFGPKQHPEKLIPKFILRSLGGDSLPLYGDGSNVRQWLFVEDLCDALIHVLDHDSNTVFNVAGPEKLTNLQIANMIVEKTGGNEDLIEFVEDRKGHDFRYSIDGSNIESTLDFKPSTSFENGLEKTVNWYRAKQDWYNNW